MSTETFLVAYHPAAPPNAARPAAPPPETQLTLSLIIVRQITELGDVRAFTPETQEDAQHQAEGACQAQSLSNLKQIGLGMMQYVQDYDEKLPPMMSAAATQKAISPYIKMVIYYEASPASDGTRGVVFLDGHAKRIAKRDWPALKAASHVPNAPPALTNILPAISSSCLV